MSDIQKYTKFRPVLTLAQLTTIVRQFRPLDDEVSKSIVRVLVPMIAKVEVGAISPAYKLSETHARKLSESSRRQSYESGDMTPQEEAEYESEILGL